MKPSITFRSLACNQLRKVGGIHAAIAFVSLTAALALAEATPSRKGGRGLVAGNSANTSVPARLTLSGLCDRGMYAQACNLVASGRL